MHIHTGKCIVTCINMYIIMYINDCPLLSSSQQTGAPNFLTGGSSQGGFGRCNASCLPPAQPPVASSMLGAGIVGAGALRLFPGASAIGTAAPGWLHAALHTVDNTRAKGTTNISFTLETWIRVPSACASTYTAKANFVFVLASTGYAVALRKTTANVFWPLFFLTAAPPHRCVAGPLVLTNSTGTIGDGPGLLARWDSEGSLSCSWILAPGGGSGGGFQEVTLIFSELLLTSRDSLSLSSCSDILCTSTTNSKTFDGDGGIAVPPPYVSTTPVMRVRLTCYKGNWASSAGFTASYVGTPTRPSALPGLVVDAWHHVALSMTASGSLSLIINGTHQLAQQLPWIPAPTHNPLTSGTHATAIGRGAPAWQNGNLGQACLEVDELRFWTESRKASDIVDTMNAGCQSVAVAASARLAACYSFDAVGNADGGGKLGHFFPDASQNQIPAFTAAHGSTHLQWCVNMDDEGKLMLDSDSTPSTYNMWGYCTSAPRLPGAGFDYSEAAIEQAAAHRLENTAAVLEHYPGCGDVPLR